MYTTIILAAMLTTGAPRYQRVVRVPQGISYATMQPQVMYTTPSIQGQVVQVINGVPTVTQPAPVYVSSPIIQGTTIYGAAPTAQPTSGPVYQSAPMYQPATRYTGGFSTFSRGSSCPNCR